MKRPISDLTEEECEEVFRRLGLPSKRLLVQHQYSGIKEVVIFANSAPFRDVAQIICGHLDLQSWGRLRRTCRAFRHVRHAQWDELSAFFARDVDDLTLPAWKAMARKCYRACRAHFRAAIRRVLFYAHELMRVKISDFEANRPPPELIHGLDGVVRSVPARAPQNFDLQSGLQALDAFVLGVGQTYDFQSQNRWFKLPFSTDSIHYPYGFFVSTSKNPHGNAFTEDWRNAISADGYSLSIGIPKNQRAHYASQKLQLRSLI